MNFKYFQIQKWMLQAGRAEKVDEKMGPLCSFHVSFLSYDPWIVEKSAFFNFVLTSAKKSKYIKQFTYIHLKCLATCFQKMLLFTMLWLNVLKILVFEIEELC